MDIQALLKKKRYGDWQLVSELTGISVDNVKMQIIRGKGPDIDVIVEAFSRIVNSRESLLANYSSQTVESIDDK